jgi:SHS2 domain-containing protein
LLSLGRSLDREYNERVGIDSLQLKKNYEFLEHTADIAIRVRGKDLKALFKNAATAVFDIIAERKTRKGSVVRLTIAQEAENLDELFVNWLNELLSLSAARNLIFTEFKIQVIERKSLKAVVSGETRDHFKMNAEIKAATYHQLQLEETASGWQAALVLDV